MYTLSKLPIFGSFDKGSTTSNIFSILPVFSAHKQSPNFPANPCRQLLGALTAQGKRSQARGYLQAAERHQSNSYNFHIAFPIRSNYSAKQSNMIALGQRKTISFVRQQSYLIEA
ncbi:MAG: hypothetical protein LBT94_01485 [Prevotellaceae bacterium]|jgi:hypothetical protein|nr:hypothetical protein [Prevotellaceae bacterium]